VIFLADELDFEYGALTIVHIGKAVGGADGQLLVDALIIMIVGRRNIKEAL
jgi:hypothetical protein